LSNTDVIKALIAAAQRGVKVGLVMTYSTDWTDNFRQLTAAEIDVKTYVADASLYLREIDFIR